jgi:hypothetical protein
MSLQGYISIHYHSTLKINDYFSVIKTIDFSSSVGSYFFPFLGEWAADVPTFSSIVPPFESPALALPGTIKNFMPAPAEEARHYLFKNGSTT